MKRQTKNVDSVERLARERIAAIAVATVVLVLASSCGGGGDHTQNVQCASTGPSVNEVVLGCSGQSSPSTEYVFVQVGGPTTTAAGIEGFNFDVVFDPSKLSFEPGSEAAGSMLEQFDASPLIAAHVASGEPGRLVVGIHRGMGQGGVAGPETTNFVLRLSFRLTGARGGPWPLRFENAEAVDVNGAKIAEIVFRDGLSLSDP